MFLRRLAHHDVFVESDTGERLVSVPVPRASRECGGSMSWSRPGSRIPGEVPIGFESDGALVVEALIAAGYQVFAVNSLAVSRCRDRPRSQEASPIREAPMSP
jgi:hypothetical protein